MKTIFVSIAVLLLTAWIVGVQMVDGFAKNAEFTYQNHSAFLSEVFGVGFLVLGIFAMLTMTMLFKVWPAVWVQKYEYIMRYYFPIVSVIFFVLTITWNSGGDVLNNPFPPAFSSLAGIGFYMPCMSAGICIGWAIVLKILEK